MVIGVLSFNDFFTWTAMFISRFCSKGNSCSFFIACVAELYFEVPIMDLAAKFWHLCSLFLFDAPQLFQMISAYEKWGATKELYSILRYFNGMHELILCRFLILKVARCFIVDVCLLQFNA